MRWGLTALLLCIALKFGGLRPAAAAQCYLATSASSHALCWLDLSSYTTTPGVATSGGPSPLSFTLPDGSTLALSMKYTVTPTSGQTATTTLYNFHPSTYALDVTSYVGVSGTPIIYTRYGQPVTTTLSGITLQDPTGKVLSSVKMAGADAEGTNASDESIGWSTAGSVFSAYLQLMPRVVDGATAPICSLSGVGTSSVSCAGNALTNGNNVPAYIFSSVVTSAQNFVMNSSSAESQGYAFAVDIAYLTATETLVGRSNSGDQIAVNIVNTARLGTTLASATTSGTGTTASTSVGVFPTDTYRLSEAATSGSLSNYVTAYACTNSVSSSTTLPSGSGISLTVTPAVDDQISCAFTNDALLLTNAASAAQYLAAPATVTDTFTLKNTSAVAARFTIGTIGVSASSSGSITPSGYVFGGTTYTTLAAAQSAIAAAAATAANGTISFGVQYSAPATPQTISTSLAATAMSGSSASSSSTAAVTDTLGTGSGLSKTGTTAASPGGIIAWTILTTNNGPSGNDNAVFSDPVPAGLTIAGTPTCGSATGGAACGAVSVSGNTVTSTIATFPAFGSVTFSIHAVAGSAGSYTNKATLTPVSGSAVSSSLTTSVALSNGLNETVRNITTGGASGQTTAITSPGDTLEFDLSFTNTSGVTLSNFTFSDPLPANMTFASATCGALPAGITACSATTPAVGGSGTVSFSFTGTLASGSTLTAAIRIKVI